MSISTRLGSAHALIAEIEALKAADNNQGAFDMESSLMALALRAVVARNPDAMQLAKMALDTYESV